MQSLVGVILAVLSVVPSEGYAPGTQGGLARYARMTCRLHAEPAKISASLAGRSFQLEEMENDEDCFTEVHLRKDHSVECGVTDGPIPEECRGVWNEYADGTFKMELTRKFVAEQNEEGSDMGDFSFQVKRTFVGDKEKVGEKAAMEGSMHDVDEILGDRVVGYFNLIESSEEQDTTRQNYQQGDNRRSYRP